jgi:hypothetical protein
MTNTPFHSGVLAVQERAGEAAIARRNNADRALAETYVRPLEREIFARSHAGGEGDCEQHVI